MKKYNLQTYLQNKQMQQNAAPVYRSMCKTCMCPEFSCYCQAVHSFNPQIQFVILIHPIEYNRRIATGRMSHLVLEGSHLIKGQDYSANAQVNNLLSDPNNHALILYPGRLSTNVTAMGNEEKMLLFPKDKKITFFVIDGTWATARKMIRQSQNLQSIPRICFSPSSPSNFRVRKQPAAHCVSTIEAIHETIELVGDACGFQTVTRQHDRLLYAFDFMVERQLEFVKKFA
ncbi:MAG: DTW domain-containing protein [Bdellovibrionaceae bacterium]|nr:DTW domain-containing protein [Bdellovibrio sp.]